MSHPSMQLRREAKRRLPPIGGCGCIRDPLWDQHLCDNDIGDVRADAIIQTAEHLADLGTPGIFDVEECRAMWRRGRRDLSVRCHRYATGGAA